MKADFRTYARAAGISLLGLGIQIALGLALLIYGSIAGDRAAVFGSVVVLILSAVWLVLAIVLDQHRRERIEEMEAQSLDAVAARESSVFGTVGDELRVQAKRLAWMHSFLLPAFSLLLAAGLLFYGVTRYLRVTDVKLGAEGKVVTDSLLNTYVAPSGATWAMAIGAVMAVAGFLFAWYTSALARTPQIRILRAGAGASAGMFVVGLLLAVFNLVELTGAEKFGRWLLVVVPVIAVVLGVEIVLNFVLNLYRPRKPGEAPRPALESWLLGLMAAPDQIAKSVGGAIQYQFGVDITGSWAYEKLRAWTPRLAVLGLMVLWLMTCFTVVGPDQRAVHTRLGSRLAERGPGLVVHLPWPIDRVERTRVTSVREMALATPRPPEDVSHILWTNDHRIAEESKVLVRAGRPAGAPGAGRAEQGAAGGGDEGSLAVVIVEVPLMFRIADLGKYEALAEPASRDGLIRSIARREKTRYLTTLEADQLVGVKRTEASAELRRRIEAALAQAEAGVEVVFCAIEGVHPPRGTEGATAAAYEQIVGDQVRAIAKRAYAERDATAALIKAAGSVEAARAIVSGLDALEAMRAGRAGRAVGGAGGGGANVPGPEAVAAQEAALDALVASAGGEAASILARARADRWQRVMLERGRAEAYSGRLAAFQANRRLYMATAYFQTLTDVLKDARLYIVDDSVPDLRTTLDLKDVGSSTDVFSAETK
jgi:regulator of protease activity HflC (stomatin/prohibitin superfamily)